MFFTTLCSYKSFTFGKKITMAISDNLKKVVENIQKLKVSTNKLLSGDEYGMINLSFNADIDRMINRFGFLAGIDVSSPKPEDHPPVTNFMGEDINAPVEIDPEDIKPGEEEKQAFLAKVEKLYNELDTIAPEGIINSYTLPEDKLVLRGVAKRAGVDGYEDKEITVDFIEEISKAIKSKAESDKEQKIIDAKLADSGAGTGTANNDQTDTK